jgi:hypothetical protein
MKLHPDGTLEGTPEEIMKYQLLKPMTVKPLGPATSISSPLSGIAQGISQSAEALKRLDERYPGAASGPYTTSVPSQAHYR